MYLKCYLFIFQMQLDEQARLVAERGMVLIGNEEEDEDAAAFDAKTSEEEQEKRTRAIVSAETATILSGMIFDREFCLINGFNFFTGRVAVNTEQGSEALTVHGNIQLSGQVMQPSDLRIKRVLKEVDPKEQLENVKKIKIVQYKYRPEFVSQLPQEERHQLQRVPHTGIIGKRIV